MPKEPMDAINEETISVSINGYEMEALIKAVACYIAFLPPSHPDKQRLANFIEKIGPGVTAQATRQKRIMRDGMN